MIEIIIVNYKSVACLQRCLSSIYATAGGYVTQVRVYDNSCDDEVLSLGGIFQATQFFRNERNIGFAAAVNQGLRNATAPYVMLLNPDTIVHHDFFHRVLDFLESHHSVGLMGPKILHTDGRVQGSARAFPTPLTGLFGRTSLFSRLFPKNRLTRANVLTGPEGIDSPLEVDWVSGACMIARRLAITETGLMDERFFMYWEDADWCRRITHNGWKIVYFPQAAVTHLCGKSSDKRPVKSLFHFTVSAYRLYAKYADQSVSFLTPFVFGMLAMRFYALAFRLLFSSYRKPSKRIGMVEF